MPTASDTLLLFMAPMCASSGSTQLVPALCCLSLANSPILTANPNLPGTMRRLRCRHSRTGPYARTLKNLMLEHVCAADAVPLTPCKLVLHSQQQLLCYSRANPGAERFEQAARRLDAMVRLSQFQIAAEDGFETRNRDSLSPSIARVHLGSTSDTNSCLAMERTSDRQSSCTSDAVEGLLPVSLLSAQYHAAREACAVSRRTPGPSKLYLFASHSADRAYAELGRRSSNSDSETSQSRVKIARLLPEVAGQNVAASSGGVIKMPPSSFMADRKLYTCLWPSQHIRTSERKAGLARSSGPTRTVINDDATHRSISSTCPARRHFNGTPTELCSMSIYERRYLFLLATTSDLPARLLAGTVAGWSPV
ncbi:hypothetical protein C8T65DRAFT_697105 [Cerioporus squamosus]|nr:hypothetical protein C8T65DRAFT_697105 [Cerioporus squamosus]